MSFREMTVMDQKKEFILLWTAGQQSFSQLCREFGIARSTGYHYVEKYKKWGMEGLENISTRPHHSPTATPQEIVDEIIKLRKKGHTKGWGAKKLYWELKKKGIYKHVPSRSTISNILKKNGLIPERKKRKKIDPKNPNFDPKEANEVWSADFKGQFRLKNGEMCYPLTICDSNTRMILTIKGQLSTDYKTTRANFEHVFKVYGLPQQLHTDNGAPFANVKALGRMTRLGIWLMELGIEPVYSDPGHPEQNGRHERMHRELKNKCCNNPSKNMQAQQVRFNKFRKEYNENRPHEALGMIPPAQVHKKSRRLYKAKVKEWKYPDDWAIKYICQNGIIRVGKKQSIFIGTALQGKTVGLEPIGTGIYRLHYRDFLLGYVDWNKQKAYDLSRS